MLAAYAAESYMRMAREKPDYLDSSSPDNIWKAAAKGDIEYIKKHTPWFTFQRVIFANRQDGQGWAPLHYAAALRQTEAVRRFLDLGGNPLLPDSKGETPIHIALRQGDGTIAATLLDATLYKDKQKYEFADTVHRLIPPLLEQMQLVDIHKNGRPQLQFSHRTWSVSTAMYRAFFHSQVCPDPFIVLYDPLWGKRLWLSSCAAVERSIPQIFKEFKGEESTAFADRLYTERRFEDWLKYYTNVASLFIGMDSEDKIGAVDHCVAQIRKRLALQSNPFTASDLDFIARGYNELSHFFRFTKRVFSFFILDALSTGICEGLEDIKFLNKDQQVKFSAALISVFFSESVLRILKRIKVKNDEKENVLLDSYMCRPYIGELDILRQFIINEIEKDREGFTDALDKLANGNDHLPIFNFLVTRVKPGLKKWEQMQRDLEGHPTKWALDWAVETDDPNLADLLLPLAGLRENALVLNPSTRLLPQTIFKTPGMTDVLLGNGAYEADVNVQWEGITPFTPLYASLFFGRPDIAKRIVLHPRWDRTSDPRLSQLFSLFSAFEHTFAEESYQALQFEDWLDYYLDALDVFRKIGDEEGIDFCTQRILRGLSNPRMTDPHLLLKGYQSIYPKHEGKIDKIAKDVASHLVPIIQSEIGTSEGVETVLEAFQHLLKIALFVNPYFLIVLDQHQKKGVDDSLLGLNMLMATILTQFQRVPHGWFSHLHGFVMDKDTIEKGLTPFKEIVQDSVKSPSAACWYSMTATRLGVSQPVSVATSVLTDVAPAVSEIPEDAEDPTPDPVELAHPLEVDIATPAVASSTEQVVEKVKQQEKKEKEQVEEYKKALEEIKHDLELGLIDLNNKIFIISSSQQKGFEDSTQKVIELTTKVEDLKGQLVLIKQCLEVIEELRKEKKKIKQEQEELLKNEPVSSFYKTFLTGLSSSLGNLFLFQDPVKLIAPELGAATSAANTQDRGWFDIGTTMGAEEKRGRYEKALAFLTNVGHHAMEIVYTLKPLVHLLKLVEMTNPLAGSGIGKETVGLEGPTAVIHLLIEKLEKLSDESLIERTHSPFHGLTQKSLSKIGDSIARRIAFAYKEQIALLSGKDAMTFADCGVKRVIATLLNGRIKDPKDFIDHACFAIRHLKVDQNKHTFVGYDTPFKRKLEALNPSIGGLYEDELFRQPGMCYLEEDGTLRFFSNDPDGSGHFPCPGKPATCATKIGYMRVTKEEFDKFYNQSVKEDQVRLGPPQPSQLPQHVSAQKKEDQEHPGQSVQPPQRISVKLEQKNEAEIALMKQRTQEQAREIENLKERFKQLGKKSPTEAPMTSGVQQEQVPIETPSAFKIIKKHLEGSNHDRPLGLKNSGLDCWMNSAFQLFANLPAFQPLLITLSSTEQMKPLCRAVKDYQSKLIANVNTRNLCEWLYDCTYSPIFQKDDDYDGPITKRDGSSQEDPIEFFKHVLSSKILPLRVKTIIYDPANPLDRKESEQTKDSGEILISLDLNKDTSSFKEVWESFFKNRVDVVESDEEGKQKVQIKTFTKSPDDFTLHFKRFFADFDPNSKSLKGQKKLAQKINIGMTITLSKEECPSEQASYDCHGIVLHTGSLDSGHCTAYVKKGGKWWYLDDDKPVASVTEDEVKKKMQEGYIFHYSKQHKPIC